MRKVILFSLFCLSAPAFSASAIWAGLEHTTLHAGSSSDDEGIGGRIGFDYNLYQKRMHSMTLSGSWSDSRTDLVLPGTSSQRVYVTGERQAINLELRENFAFSPMPKCATFHAALGADYWRNRATSVALPYKQDEVIHYVYAKLGAGYPIASRGYIEAGAKMPLYTKLNVYGPSDAGMDAVDMSLGRRVSAYGRASIAVGKYTSVFLSVDTFRFSGNQAISSGTPIVSNPQTLFRSMLGLRYDL